VTDGWPRLVEVGERVEVDLAAYLLISKYGRGAVVDRDLDDGDDPQYLVELDQSYPELDGAVRALRVDHKEETGTRRWFAWEFVRPLNILELIAEAAQ
jgi:hypothetical protein